MELKNKQVLILGLSVTGISAVETLSSKGAKVTVLDIKTEEELSETLKKLETYRDITFLLGKNEIALDSFDFILKSPGIPPHHPVLVAARKKKLQILSDLELSYRMTGGSHYYTITGTNGKTTTTVLLGEIIRNSGAVTHVVGNIGVGILERTRSAASEDVFVIEASSFQLEDTTYFAPHIAAVTNFSPDHLDWHGSYENYMSAKLRISSNQTSDDYLFLNKDDPESMKWSVETKAKILYFSKTDFRGDGVFCQQDTIFIREGLKVDEIMPISEIQILGDHNLENVLCAVGMAYFGGVSKDVIRNSVSSFKGVEHRIEFVREVNGSRYYNDSKGTNPASTIKALQAMVNPVILIAGGYDKGVNFDELSELFYKKVELLILMGATKDQMRASALRAGFDNIQFVENMEEAVKMANLSSSRGTDILLSPACASWGMYRNYEERGKDFKNLVLDLKER